MIDSSLGAEALPFLMGVSRPVLLRRLCPQPRAFELEQVPRFGSQVAALHDLVGGSVGVHGQQIRPIVDGDAVRLLQHERVERLREGEGGKRGVA